CALSAHAMLEPIACVVVVAVVVDGARMTIRDEGVLTAVLRIAAVDGAGIVIVAVRRWAGDAHAGVADLVTVADRAVIPRGVIVRWWVMEAARLRVAAVGRARVRITAVRRRTRNTLAECVAGLVPVAGVTVGTRCTLRREVTGRAAGGRVVAVLT